MGSWRSDQSKHIRRVIWGKTRGEDDPTWREFRQRMAVHPALAHLRAEKIGSEIHCWRPLKSPEPHWASCLRFVTDELGYWSVFYRSDEGRWRTTSIKDLPSRTAVEAAAECYSNLIAPTDPAPEPKRR